MTLKDESNDVLKRIFSHELALWPNLAGELPELVHTLKNTITRVARGNSGFLDELILEGRPGIHKMTFSDLCAHCDTWLDNSWREQFPGFAKLQVRKHAYKMSDASRVLTLLAVQDPLHIFVPASDNTYAKFDFDQNLIDHLKLTHELISRYELNKIGMSSAPTWSIDDAPYGVEIIVSRDAFWFAGIRATQDVTYLGPADPIRTSAISFARLHQAVCQATEDGDPIAFIDVPPELASQILTDLSLLNRDKSRPRGDRQ